MEFWIYMTIVFLCGFAAGISLVILLTTSGSSAEEDAAARMVDWGLESDVYGFYDRNNNLISIFTGNREASAGKNTVSKVREMPVSRIAKARKMLKVVN